MGDNIVVTVPGNNADEARSLSQTARFYIRPVIQAVPAGPAPTGGPSPAPTPPTGQSVAERIAIERQLRQSTNKRIQYIALELQASRCDEDDVLAGNDDPSLPLITCSTDHKSAYLLAPSTISGDQIQDASSGLDSRSGGYVVDLQFNGPAASTWADYTAANIGTQVAFTLDTQVVSAPYIREAIPGGRTQITGGDPPFTKDSARQLADVLNYGPLPLAFEPSAAESVPPKPGAAKTVSTWLPAARTAGAVGLLLALIGALVILYLPRFRRPRV